MRLPINKLWLPLLGAVALVGVVVLASKRHAQPNRCDTGWLSVGARCCARGQTIVQGHCAGEPAQCPAGFHLAQRQRAGCVSNPHHLHFKGAFLKLGPNDWQSEQVPRIEERIGPFWVDATEVNGEQWEACVEAKQCPARELGEPGQPVVRVSLEDARRFCSARRGRLPTVEERIALSAGDESRRYPWGQTGLVCRRAMFGVSHGPCAQHGTEPDITGAHAAGQSPEGVLDLSGNVAELAVDAQSRAWKCGGSFRSDTALELKSWACSLFLGATDDVGFRCVYDEPVAEG